MSTLTGGSAGYGTGVVPYSLESRGTGYWQKLLFGFYFVERMGLSPAGLTINDLSMLSLSLRIDSKLPALTVSITRKV